MRKSFRPDLFRVACMLVVIVTGWSCTKEHAGRILDNIAPISRLANVPPNNYISKNPRLTLYWVGDDPDGFVVGFRYRWNFRLSATQPFVYKDWSTILNIGVDKSGGEKFALMTDAPYYKVPGVYKYFATLPPEGLDTVSANTIDRGDSLRIPPNETEGYHVWASNPKTVNGILYRFPIHVNPNGGTFIFDSQDTLNPHTFFVEAIDDQGDTSIASSQNQVTFETPQVPPPHTEVITFPSDTVMVSDFTTDVFKGIPFTFQGFDPNSRTLDFSWVVDRDEWPANSIPWSPFSSDPNAYVSALHFRDPRDTVRIKHTIYVRGRNEFGSIDTLGYFDVPRDSSGVIVYRRVYSQRDFYCVYPKWLLPGYPKRVMLFNCAAGFTTNPDPAFPSRDSLDAFYTSLFDANGYASKFDVVRASSDNPRYWPSLDVFAKYSSVFLYADVIRPDVFGTGIDIKEDRLFQYVNVGGKMVITAWVFSLARSRGFMQLIAHMDKQPLLLRVTDSAFVGATAVPAKGYPDVKVDSLKVASYGGGLPFTAAGRSWGFGEIIYQFHESHCEQITPTFCLSWEGRTVGVKYDGLTYKVVYFGFPLYYCEKPTVQTILQKAFQDIGE